MNTPSQTIRKFSLTSFKFFLAGKGISVQTGKYFAESILVGLVAGLVVVAFRYLINIGTKLLMEDIGHHKFLSTLSDGAAMREMFSSEAFLDPYRWLMVIMPPIGALTGYMMIRKFASLKHARGTDSAIHAFHYEEGVIPGVVVPVKSVASVLTVASGGSAGYEGPVTLIGASVGSVISKWLHLSAHARRIMMAAGLSAGIAALFQAPLAGAIFGFEIFYSSSDIEYETVLPSFVASAVSYTVYSYFFGWGTLFEMPPECIFDSGLRLLPYFIFAFIVTFGARFYISFFRYVEQRFEESKVKARWKVFFGGLVTGVIGFFFPDILGTSYSVIQASFTAGQSELFAEYGPLTIAGFVAFFFMKAIATAFTVGSGGSGGVFAPAIVCGGTLGAATGLFFQNFFPASFEINPAAFALVGMSGFLASSIRIPLTAIVMVAEISGNHSLLVPAMWVCGISFWLNNGWSLYRSQVHSRQSSPVHFHGG